MRDRDRFRVWCHTYQQWEEHTHLMQTTGDLFMMRGGLRSVSKKTHTVEWCVGVRDIETKLIYEGDILRIRLNWRENVNMIVSYQSYGYFCGPHSLGTILHEAKIVGNIHENPELEIYK